MGLLGGVKNFESTVSWSGQASCHSNQITCSQFMHVKHKPIPVPHMKGCWKLLNSNVLFHSLESLDRSAESYLNISELYMIKIIIYWLIMRTPFSDMLQSLQARQKLTQSVSQVSYFKKKESVNFKLPLITELFETSMDSLYLMTSLLIKDVITNR